MAATTEKKENSDALQRDKKKELGKSRDKMKETNGENSYAMFQLVANPL
jgi:hypothetical protein